MTKANEEEECEEAFPEGANQLERAVHLPLGEGSPWWFVGAGIWEPATEWAVFSVQKTFVCPHLNSDTPGPKEAWLPAADWIFRYQVSCAFFRSIDWDLVRVIGTGITHLRGLGGTSEAGWVEMGMHWETLIENRRAGCE